MFWIIRSRLLVLAEYRWKNNGRGHDWSLPGLTVSAGVTGLGESVRYRKALELWAWILLRAVGSAPCLAGTHCGTSSLRQSGVIDVSTCAFSVTGDLVVVSRFLSIHILNDFGSSKHHHSQWIYSARVQRETVRVTDSSWLLVDLRSNSSCVHPLVLLCYIGDIKNVTFPPIPHFLPQK